MKGKNNNKYIKLLNLRGEEEIEPTDFEYKLDEIISVNSKDNKYKCIEIINSEEGDTYYCFKQGIKEYKFDW